MDSLLGLSIFLPLVVGLVLPLLAQPLGKKIGWAAWVFPVVSFVCLMIMGAGLGASPYFRVEWPWVPSLGISLSFVVDGLSLLFALIVSGVGVLIFLYANFYFQGEEPQLNRFYGYLLLFMGAMLGTVLADNLLLLFIFWELTGITSFLLIGFYHEKESARVGARAALLVTMLTGLVMLVGIILLGQAAGTYSWTSLRHWAEVDGRVWLSGPWGQAVLAMLMLGAFGKSAQFPFHFWLPQAMEAPTPVSAYLHSATMVKLGVFWAARLFPIFAGVDLWAPLLMVVGFFTMALAAFLALRSNHLKAILAYSTVTQLGALIGIYGLGSRVGLAADGFHILDHVFYKAALFMIAGILTHVTGCKDIRELGGMWRRMPVLALATAVACASMAGLPLTMGFVAKELLLADLELALRAGFDAVVWFAAGCVTVASVCKVAFAVRFFTVIFLGEEQKASMEHGHRPSIGLQVPVVVLVGCSLLCGWFLQVPEFVFHFLGMEGSQGREVHLVMWHGFTPALGVSLLLLGLGLAVFFYGRATDWRWTQVPRLLRFDQGFEKLLDHFNRFTQWVTYGLRSESPMDYLPVMLSVMVLGLGGYLGGELWRGLGLGFVVGAWSFQPDWLRSFTVGLIVLAALGVVWTSQWTSQLILLSAVGFLTTFLFVLYRAPDLALTQILVEAATLMMVLLLLARFPKQAQEGEDRKIFGRRRVALDLGISMGLGVVVTVMVLVANAGAPERRLGNAFLEQTKTWAEGTNAVNTILVDFRGFDTLGEISVLVIAALGAIGLFFRYKRTERERAQKALGAPGFDIFRRDRLTGENR